MNHYLKRALCFLFGFLAGVQFLGGHVLMGILDVITCLLWIFSSCMSSKRR